MPPDAASTAALNLRPLPLGELLDRAFTLYFRNIVAFSALLAVVLVPSVIVSYIQTRQLFGAYISLIQHQITVPNSTPDLSALTAAAPSPALTALQLAFAFIIIPISYAAVVVGVSRAYVGLPVTFADCYRQALRRWLAVLILIFIWFVLALFAFFAFFLVLGIFAGVIGALGSLLGRGVGVVLAAILFVLAIASIGLAILLYLTSAMSLVAVVLEKVDPFRALGEAFARVFGGRQFWKGFALAFALAGIYFGATAVFGGAGALLAFFLKSPALYIVCLGLMQLFFVPFAVVTAAVYYYDLRIRRDGYDLQMLIDQLASPAQAGAPQA